MLRRQLPVASPIAPAALVRAGRRALRGTVAPIDAAEHAVGAAFGARGVALTDGGTSALVLALRLTTGVSGTVALPAYGCPDLVAAARHAGARIRLYDLDPATLGPDLDSLARAFVRGADAVVLVHLYGYPADVPAVAALARAHGAFLIEDAAQGAWGTLHGRRLGAYGPLTVLSFGRGKGITAGSGGALLTFDARWDEPLEAAAAQLGAADAGTRDVAVATAAWALGRPALYWIPSALPWLALGETRYRPAHEPRAMSAAARELLRVALTGAERELVVRRRHAAALASALRDGDARLRAVMPIAGGAPGYLRFPVRARAAVRPVSALGILRGYPRTLAEEPAAAPALHPGERAGTGAAELRDALLTLPTHGRLTLRDVHHLREWLRGGRAPERDELGAPAEGLAP